MENKLFEGQKGISFISSKLNRLRNDIDMELKSIKWFLFVKVLKNYRAELSKAANLLMLNFKISELE